MINYNEAFSKIECFPDVTEKSNVDKISIRTRRNTKLTLFFYGTPAL